MMGHPGKKLLFMGQDFAQFQEWSEERELDWYLLQEDQHRWMQAFVTRLLHIYKKYPCLYERDYHPGSFEWINAQRLLPQHFQFCPVIRKREKESALRVQFHTMRTGGLPGRRAAIGAPTI